MSPAAVPNVRVGVAGLGFGAAVHVPVLKTLPGVEVVGVAGRTAGKARRVALALGVPNGCDSVERLLDLGLDAITLALPPDQTAPAVAEALRAGVAVLCEKPLAADPSEAAALVALADGQVTAMDFIFGELETFRRLKQLIDGKTLGAVRHAHVLWLTESWANRGRIWSWKTDAAQRGGVISLFGTHLFYLAEWLFGPVRAVRAHSGTPVAATFAPSGCTTAEDLVNCRMEHHAGPVFAATFGNANPGISLHRWTVVFERGTAVLENQGPDYITGFRLSVTANGDVAHFTEPATDGDGRLAAFGRLAQRFLDGLRAGSSVYPDLAVGARVQTMDAAVRASAADGNEFLVG